MLQELLPGVVQMKPIKMTALRKGVNFLSYSGSRVACHLKNQGRSQSLPYQSMHIEILDNLTILSIENWFGDDEVIFQHDNASCHGVKFFFRNDL